MIEMDAVQKVRNASANEPSKWMTKMKNLNNTIDQNEQFDIVWTLPVAA